MIQSPFPLYDTIEGLRVNEEIFITANISKLDEIDEEETLTFLQQEYSREVLNYPFSAPRFDGVSALWSSKVIYFAAQLLVNRVNTNSKLDDLLPIYNESINASTILSADLCLRFLPFFIVEFRNIDPDDQVLKRLMRIAEQFHYAAIGVELDLETLDFQTVIQNDCLRQLYLDRVVERQCITLGQSEYIKPWILQNLGDYKSFFWREL